VNADDARRVLRWYPRQWRRRYGDELLALLEDIFGDEPLSVRCRIALCRSGTIERIREMRRRFSNTYTGYSIGCAIVWAVILAGVSLTTDTATRHTFALVFYGWVIGWLSATIARVVYPPPKRHTGRS
jgi:hypothetical protein